MVLIETTEGLRLSGVSLKDKYGVKKKMRRKKIIGCRVTGTESRWTVAILRTPLLMNQFCARPESGIAGGLVKDNVLEVILEYKAYKVYSGIPILYTLYSIETCCSVPLCRRMRLFLLG